MGSLLDCIRRRNSTPGSLGLPPTPEWSRPSLQLRPHPQGQPGPSSNPCVSSRPEGRNSTGVNEQETHFQHDHPQEADYTLHSETKLGLEDSPFFSDPSSWFSTYLSDKPQDSGTVGVVDPQRELGIGVGTDWTKPSSSSSRPKAARRLFSDCSPKLTAPLSHGNVSSTYGSSQSPSAHSRNHNGVAIGSAPSQDIDNSNHSSAVDVNYANVHQLCVIGLTRTQAEAVVTHRVNTHRHFQSKEELRLILGIDEEKWLRIKARITLIPAGLGITENAYCSAREGGLRHTEHSEGAEKRRISVNINLCNYYELCVVGLSKSQASAVVDYRVRNGYYTSTEQIKAVPGISDQTYHFVRSKLTLVPGQQSKHLSSSRKQRLKNNSLALNSSPLHRVWHSPSTILPAFTVSDYQSDVRSPHTQNSLAAVDSSTSPRVIASQRRNGSLAGASPLSVNSPIHPVVFVSPNVTNKCSPRVSGGRTSKGTVRITSWNLQCFNEKKTETPGVLEVVCSVILQHGFDVIAVQEIGSKGALEKVCQELNYPSLPKVLSFGSNARQWDCCVSTKATGRMFQGMEYNGFLWNKCSGISFEGAGMVESEVNYQGDRLFVRKPFVGKFSVRNWDFVIISVHLKAENWGGKSKGQVESEVQNLSLLIDSIVGDSDILLLGDFNMHPKSPCFQSLVDHGYTPVFGSDEPTNISARNLSGSMCYDNIWVTPHLMNARHNGTRDVVRRGLQHPQIAGGQAGERGGTVSDHCPIWVGFTA